VLIYYLFLPRVDKKTAFALLLILSSALLVGYSSGKRGIYFIIPAMLLLIILIAIPKLISSGYFKRKLLSLAGLGFLIFPIVIFGMINSRGLNYSLTGSESSFEVISQSLDYADEYENATDQYGRTIGRSNTSAVILATTFADPSLFLFGSGYGSTK